ncbi:RNA-binding domain-containing protein [Metallosphaera hakonensis]|uniref:RNA-binding domain-containing protein n=1 Tax=Metallosphaera hakonensis TaxID=79601 RepID=UPI0006CF4342|nr:RNA-binding domain-containing protein [Metallosphaera hakonensis]
MDALFGPIGGSVLRQEVKGHYGDPIVTFKIELEGKPASEVTERIISKLNKADIIFLVSTIESRSQGNRIYLRIDKQYLISQGKIALKDGEDVIKIVISLRQSIDQFKEVLKQYASGNVYT